MPIAHHHLLPEVRRERRDAEVDRLPPELHLDSPILRAASLGNVELGQGLQAGHHGILQPFQHSHVPSQHAVHTQPYPHIVQPPLQVDVTRLGFHGITESDITHLDYWC